MTFTLLSNSFADLNITDITIRIKPYHAETIRSTCTSDERVGFEPELPVKLARPSRIDEVGISTYACNYERRGKIVWCGGVCAILSILQENPFAR
jgi:hypothetical protein